MKRKVIGVATVFFLLSACAGGPYKPVPKKTVVYGPADTISIIVPAKEGVNSPKTYVSNLSGNAVSWGGWSSSGETHYYGKWKFEEETFDYTTGACGWISGNCSPVRVGSATVKGDLVLESVQDVADVKLIPKSYAEDSTKNILTGQPHFDDFDADVSDLVSMLSKLSYRFEFEVNSDYSADSVSSNFARLLQKGNDSELKKTYKDTYILKTTSGAMANVAVETYPYRNGSKAVVTVWLTPSVTGNTLNYSAPVQEIKKRVEEIVKA